MSERVERALVDLAREQLARGRPLRLVARGGSMRPWIPPGSRLLVRPAAAAALAVGDVVLGELAPGRLVVHRLLVRPGPDGRPARTKGDRNPRADRPLASAELLGRVERVLRPDGAEAHLLRPAWRALGWSVALLSPWLGLAVGLRRALAGVRIARGGRRGRARATG